MLDTLDTCGRRPKVWFEITTLLIPGRNDSDPEITRRSNGSGTTWAATCRCTSPPSIPTTRCSTFRATPPSTLTRARRIALADGLRFVYTGNVHDIDGAATFCPGCGAAVVVRDWYDIRRYELTGTGACRHCGTGLPGVFDGHAGTWGRRRLPVTPGQAAR